jgi:hypothetical protein
MAVQISFPSLNNFGMTAQSQVVVGAKVQQPLIGALDVDFHSLASEDDPLIFEGSRVLNKDSKMA